MKKNLFDLFTEAIDDFLKHSGDGFFDDLVEDILQFLLGDDKND